MREFVVKQGSVGSERGAVTGAFEPPVVLVHRVDVPHAGRL